MRRLRGAALAVVLLLVLAACGAPHITAPQEKPFPVDTPELVALKQAAGIDACPTGQVPRGTGGLPKVTLDCLGGGLPVDLSTLHGPLMINVWSSGCEPCREEMPVLGEFHRKYGAQVPILGIDFEDSYPGVALTLAKRRKATYPQVVDFYGHIQGTKTLHIPGQPVFFFLKPDGSVSRVAGGLTSLGEVVAMVNEQLGLHLS